MRILIQINNNKAQLLWERKHSKVIAELYKSFKIRHPNAFYIKRSSKGGFQSSWDGYVDYITKTGFFLTGLLPQVISYLDEKGIKYKIKDYRKLLKVEEIPLSVGEEYFREYQLETIKSVILNKVGGIPFPRGVINEATNAGKTLIMIGLYLSYSDAKCIILLNDSNLFDQFLTDMPRFFTNDEWGYLRGDRYKKGDIMVCMVQTLVRRMDTFNVSDFNMVLVDECDLSDNATYKKVLTQLHNAIIRVGLSGSVFLSKLAKDKIKTQNIKGFFGDELIKIKNKELIEKGYSTPIKIFINKGNLFDIHSVPYPEEYRKGISKNGFRVKTALQRVNHYLNEKKYPILVITKYHEHVHHIYRIFQRHFNPEWRLEMVHHKTKDRRRIIKDFREGKIDVLISSYFIKRGQNMPLIQVIINLGGGLGPEGPLQVIGRGLRKHVSKDIFYYEDFFDEGEHLKRHSKRRIIYYKNEGFEVNFLY